MVNGLYIEGKVNDVNVHFTTDTGASETILSSRVYAAIPKNNRPDLGSHRPLTGAGGSNIKVLGQGIFDISLGPLELTETLVVADIQDDVLLGIDLLQNHEKGQADILLSTGEIHLRGYTIPCIQKGVRDVCRRVRSAQQYCIPAMSEMIVNAYVDRADLDSKNEDDLMFEPSEEFMADHSLLVAPAVLNTAKRVTVPLRVMNPYERSLTLYQDAVMGTAEEFDGLVTEVNEPEFAVRNVTGCPESRGDQSVSSQDGVLPYHLQNLYDRSIISLTETEKQKFRELLLEYQGIFSKDEWDLGQTNLAEHEIDTGNNRPVKQPPRRVPIALAEEERKAIIELKDKGIIRPSNSPWASPLVLVQKKNGKIRVCVDYRRVNNLTSKDAFPLPKIQDCLDSVAGSVLFSALDLTAGYHQVKVKESDVPKTAFVTKYGHFEYVSMPFGLTNAPATFQRVMELALNGLQWQICLIYIDDILIFSRNFDEHLDRLRQVVQRIKEAGLKLKPEKCQMFQEEVTFLGHRVTKSGVLPDNTNIEKIINWKTSTTVTEVRQFLGMASYYRRFVKNFSVIAKPITELTKKDVPFYWSDKCEEAFQTLKSILIGPEVMGHPDPDEGTFLLDCDACDVGIGAVLSQMQQGRERVIAYASRTLNKAERNYCVTDKELLAVRHFVEYFKQYLLGQHFTVRSDHQALVWLFKLKEPKGRVARWIEILSAYNFELIYRCNPQHTNADGLSRCPNPRDCTCQETDNMELLPCGPCDKCRKRAEQVPAELRKVNTRSETRTKHVPGATPWQHPYSAAQLKTFQLQDEDISPVLLWKSQGQKPPTAELTQHSPATRHYVALWDQLILDGDLLYKIHRGPFNDLYRQLIVPKSLRKEVLTFAHSSLLSGHLGIKKSKFRVLQHSYWYQLKDDVKIFVSCCDNCARNKPPSHLPKGKLGGISVGSPWEHLASDFIGPLPVSGRGNRYVLVFMDYFTKWVEIFAVPDQTASTTARVLLDEIISRYGCPLMLHSDQGRNYESLVISELCQLLQIKKTRTTPRNPKCNGMVERYNKTVIRMIRAYLSGEQEDWDLHLGCIASAYRSTPQESTGFTPNMLMFGRELCMPAEIVFGPGSSSHDTVSSYGIYIEEIREKLNRAHTITREHLQKSAERNKAVYNSKVLVNKYLPGDIVWILNEKNEVGVCSKLQPVYHGPCVVLNKFSDLVFQVQVDARGEKKTLNHDKLLPYRGFMPPKWVSRLSARKR